MVALSTPTNSLKSKKNDQKTKNKSTTTTTVIHTPSTTAGHPHSTDITSTFNPTKTVDSTGTSTSSELPNSSTDSSSNETKTSPIQFAGILLVVLIVIIMIVFICRKLSGKEREGTIRLKDEPDSPEIPKFVMLPLENSDPPSNNAINNNIPLINIIDSDYIDNDNNLPLANSNESRIQNQPPMTEFRVSSTNSASTSENTHNVQLPVVVNDRQSSTSIHELEMECQNSPISSVNRMTLSDYNDFSDVQSEPYPSFESQFPSPPERVVHKDRD